MSPVLQLEWPSSVPTVKSDLLFPVMNLLFTEIDQDFSFRSLHLARALSRQLLDPDVDSMDLVPRRLGLTKVGKLSVNPTSASTVTSAGSSDPLR